MNPLTHNIQCYTNPQNAMKGRLWQNRESPELMRAESVPCTYRWRRWALFRRHTDTETPTGPGTWRSSTWSWSTWEENWRTPSCRDDEDRVRVWFSDPPPPSPRMDVKQTSTACSFWGPLRQRCAPCRGHWTHRWATHPDWNWCWKKPKEQFDQTSAGGRVCLLHFG